MRTAISELHTPNKEELLKALEELRLDLATELRWNDWNIVYWASRRIEDKD